jgi:hypothetical protein
MVALGNTARVALAVAAIAICSSVRARADTNDDDELREDVLSCEDALGHLAQCCGGFDVHVVPCHYHDRTTDGCSGPATVDKESPAFSLSESQCIRDASCDVLNATGVCGRAQAATAYTRTSATTSGFLGPPQTTGNESSHDPVCP